MHDSVQPITRTHIVWGVLAGAMTVVGAMMWALEGRGLPRTDGLALASPVGPGVSSIEAIFETRRPLADAWKAIVIHHSGDRSGTPQSIAATHRAHNLDGLGYHFVIGNGRGIGDGEVYAGYRWMHQLPGAHVGGPRGAWYNEHAIGICLIGDGNEGEFTRAQTLRLERLVEALTRKLDIPASHVYLASDLTNAQSPGRYFPEAAFRERLGAGG